MNGTRQVRPAVRSDVEAMRTIADATLFPGTLLDDMVRPFFEEPGCAELWVVCAAGPDVRGLAYCVPEEMTEGTWNLKAIAVRPGQHRLGAGRALMRDVEARLTGAGGRLLVVDTSSAAEQEVARAFYRSLGYVQEARIAGFWAAGEDKITFTKALRAASAGPTTR